MIKDIASGCVLLALSLGYYYTATGFTKSALDTSVSASAFPEMIGMIGAFFSVLLIAQGLWRMSTRHAVVAGSVDEIDDDGLKDWAKHKAALGLLGIVVVFFLALATLGYPVALACLIFAVATYQGIPVSWKTAFIAVCGALLFWLFFVHFLGIHMPAGIWDRLGALDTAPHLLMPLEALA